MNVVAIVGRLTADPKAIDTKSGDPMVTFRIAFNHKEDDASFFNCVAFGKTAELIDDYMSKGRRLGVQGYLRQREWEEKTTVEIVATNVTFLDSNKDSDDDERSSRKSSKKSSSRKSAPSRSSKTSKREREKEPEDTDTDDDDLPF